MKTLLDIDLGDVVELSTTLTDPAGAPSTGTLTVSAYSPAADDDGDGVPVDVTAASNVWTGDFKPTSAGIWRFRFRVTGAEEGIEWAAVRVRPAPLEAAA